MNEPAIKIVMAFERVARSMAWRRRVVAPGHARFEPRVPPADAPYRATAPIVFQRLVGVAVGIVYRDAAGQESRRRITIHRVAKAADGSVMLRCWCWERSAQRAFRADRIQHVYDLTTGEVVSDLAVLSGAPKPDDLADARARRAETMFELLRPELGVLVCLALCDELHGRELDVMMRHVRRRAPGLSLPEDDIIRRMGAMHAEPRLFRAAIDVLSADDGAGLRLVATTATELIDADGIISAAEFNLGLELSAALSGLPPGR